MHRHVCTRLLTTQRLEKPAGVTVGHAGRSRESAAYAETCQDAACAQGSIRAPSGALPHRLRMSAVPLERPHRFASPLTAQKSWSPQAGSRVDNAIRRFAPEFAQIKSTAAARETEGEQPDAAIAGLVEQGFGRLSVPREFGGDGLLPSEVLAVLVALARADSNIAHAFRPHVNAIESAFLSQDANTNWIYAQAAQGRIFGSGSNERHGAVSRVSSTITRSPSGDRVLNGTKYFTTGSLFADWTSASGVTEDGTVEVFFVPTDAPGVTVHPDWGGFGQRGSGSGSITFAGVRLDEATTRRVEQQATGVQEVIFAFWQLVLLAVEVGIAQSAVDDAVAYVRARDHNFSHGLSASPAEDPVIQSVIGEASSLAFSAESAFAHVTRLYDQVHGIPTDSPEYPAALTRLSLSVFQAQAVIVDATLAVTTKIFDVGGATEIERRSALDRHWRNARTVAQHNPHRFRVREVGSTLLTDSEPDYGWGRPGQ
ncbi:hypothetical protein F8O06_10630 [Pseudoclavibacter sp. CFCC 14310]|nr:hypothetical protein F8O06_10630 [Pseudoclavibacter sp. CFCC 14310]